MKKKERFSLECKSRRKRNGQRRKKGKCSTMEVIDIIDLPILISPVTKVFLFHPCNRKKKFQWNCNYLSHAIVRKGSLHFDILFKLCEFYSRLTKTIGILIIFTPSIFKVNRKKFLKSTSTIIFVQYFVKLFFWPLNDSISFHYSIITALVFFLVTCH